MPDVIVDTEALNFRSKPVVEADTLIGKVFLGQKLEQIGEADASGWIKCRAEINGGAKEGFVSSEYVRPPLGPNREALVASVHREWMRFERGVGLEYEEPFSGYIHEMWKTVGRSDLSGTNRDWPWSAAAISHCVKGAGQAYDQFKRSGLHSVYVHDAIKAREDGNQSKPFWGYRLHEAAPEVGDIICRDRGSEGPFVTYDYARAHASFSSHCDIIMRIDTTRQRAAAIGGNVKHSMRITYYDLAPGDILDSTNRVYALLKNRTN